MRPGLILAAVAVAGLAAAACTTPEPLGPFVHSPPPGLVDSTPPPAPVIKPWDPDAPEASPSTPVEAGGALPPAKANPNQGPSRRRR